MWNSALGCVGFSSCGTHAYLQLVENLPADAGGAGEVGSSRGSGRSPGGGHGNALQYPCQENPHGQRSLAGLQSPGHRESDTTE